MEVVADYGDLCGECPVWDKSARRLYWTDIQGRRFYRFDADHYQHAVVKTGMEICGFRLNEPDGFVITNSEGVWLWDGLDSTSLVVSAVDGAKLQLNDCTADPAGRLLAGSTFYDAAGGYELGRLFVVETNGGVRVLDEGFHLSNGLGFSPDGCTLYFADSMARTIYRYDYDCAAGVARNRSVFVKVPDDEGLPDGLAVDAEGFVWSAQWYGSCVVRYDPDGTIERRLAVPAKQTSSVAFGGEDLTDLFITSASKSDPTPAMPPHYDPATGPFGGQLFRFRSGIPGKPEFRAAIALR
jgi:sugar lactone lactonase YvrE